ncbi:hypothetical protein [Paenibacillus sp. UASWS1643]|uniref:hypothetical protein n=1 Tax=Paenibacillus sp. UASWS1643 TaxID=2580422 RepID=UPI00123B4627|nr:hypothetical protein [Paenibacillus sp. UASWS1643]KAA8750085.1 hypothetical protein FE296_15925 [Paenibacillus sp. UASWS1643]
MAETPVLLYGNNLSTTANTVIYTAPINKVVVLKSVIVCNLQDTPINLNMQIEGTPVIGSRPLKGYETLVIPIADLVLRPTAQLRAWVSSGTCAVRITGVELDGTMDQNGLYLIATSSGVNGTPREIITTKGKPSIIKSMVFCNSYSIPLSLNMRIGYFADNYTLIRNYKLAPYETIHIPFVDTILLGTDTLTAWVNESNVIWCHIVTKDVTI